MMNKIAMRLWCCKREMIFRGIALAATVDVQFPYYCGVAGPNEHKPEIPEYTFTGFQLVFRHGSRTSLSDETCFGDLRANYTCAVETTFGISTSEKMHAFRKVYAEQGGCMRGQLLAEQAEPQLKRVAEWVKKTYGNFVDNLYFRSTDIQRTLASMYFLRNLLLPKGKEHRVYTREYEGDALGMNRQCPKAESKEREFGESEIVREYKDSNKYTQCAKRWREVVNTEYNGSAFDCLVSAKCAGVALPGGLDIPDDLFACVVEVEAELRKIKYGVTPSEYKKTAIEACELNVGPVLAEIRSRLLQGQSGFFASHDSTIACLLQASGGLWDGIWPKYAETLVFESFSRGDRNYVRLVRDGRVVSDLLNLSDLGKPDDECRISRMTS